MAQENYHHWQKRICTICKQKFQNIAQLQQHIYSAHSEVLQDNIQSLDNLPTFNFTKKVLHGAYNVFESEVSDQFAGSIDTLFYAYKKSLFSIISNMLKSKKVFKVQFELTVTFMKQEEEEVTQNSVPMHSFMFTVENDVTLQHIYNVARENFNVRVEEYEELGSNWRYVTVDKIKLIVCEVENLIGGGKITLPKPLQKKSRSIINVPGEDGLCFMRALIAHKIHKNVNRARDFYTTSTYEPYLFNKELYNWDGIKFPFDVTQVAKFEKQNPDIGLNILIYDEQPDDIESTTFDEDNVDEESSEEESSNEENVIQTKTRYERETAMYQQLRRHIYPYMICKEQKKQIVDLLLVVNGTNSHFCYIKNIVGFLKNPNRSYVKGICRFCLQSFGTSYDQHVEYCASLGLQQTNFPKDNFMEFKNYSTGIESPFFLFGDFESLIQEDGRHKPIAYSYACVDYEGKIIEEETYLATTMEENVAEVFLASVLNLTERCVEKIKTFEQEAYKVASSVLKNIPIPTEPVECGFCKEMINPSGGNCHRHHSHLPPYKFLFYACRKHNMRARVSKEVHLFLHNMTGYDGHFLVRAASNKKLVQQMEVIGPSSEKFTSIKINNKLRILDSLNFFHASLQQATETLDKKTDFIYCKRALQEAYPNKNISLLFNKLHYPYTYFKSLEMYNETKLPEREAFYSDLTEQTITEEEYNKTKEIWDEFEIRDLREFTCLYVKIDVLIGLELFQKMRKMFIAEFRLDPAHFFSISQLGLQCCLAFTKAKFELIKDPTMHLWFEQSKRGGMAAGGTIRYAKANNKYLPDYDPTKPTSYIMYFDVNNLYPTAMSNFLPVKDFQWVRGVQLEQIRQQGAAFINSIPENGNVGYFFEVNLSFPQHTHDFFRDNPIAPYRRIVKLEELSNEQKEMTLKLGIAASTFTTPKLVADLHDRIDFKCHYRYLQQILSLGVELKSIKSCIQFSQEPILSPYLDYLNDKRKAAASKTEQNFYKLLGNSLYGKFLEDMRKRTTFKIIQSKEQAIKYNRKPTISQVIILEKDQESNDDIVILALKRLSVTLNRPLYLGCCTLDESKRIYGEFYYKFMQTMWNTGGRKCNLLAMDTDSYMCLLSTDCVYKDIKRNEEWFDLSNYNPNSETFGFVHSDKYKKTRGKMKDEQANTVISEFLYLRPKMYAYTYYKDGEEHQNGTYGLVKKAKGVERHTLANKVSFEDYKRALNSPIQLSHKFKKNWLKAP